MNRTWEIDEHTSVVAQYGTFRKKAISVNGAEIIGKFTIRKKREYTFPLPSDRNAVLSVAPKFVGQPDIELRVNGELVAELGRYAIKCKACGTTANSYDRFCAKCGNVLPTAEERANKGVVAEATKTISVLSGLFLVFGIVTYFLTKSQLAPALAKLQALDPESMYPVPVNGATYKVAELIQQLNWEPWGALVVNVILAVIMAILALWSRRASLPAILVATATYAVVLVANAILEPASIAQGIIMKIIIIGYLLRGVKAALVLRAANA
jgi:hypothetical protein